MDDVRKTARRLAAEAIAAGRPLEWFERLYAGAAADDLVVPCADRKPNPNLVDLYAKVRHLDFGRKALKVGCGLGDDAEWLAEQGFDVTAFDILPTAIAECRRRFPRSRVHYLAADLFAAKRCEKSVGSSRRAATCSSSAEVAARGTRRTPCRGRSLATSSRSWRRSG